MNVKSDAGSVLPEILREAFASNTIVDGDGVSRPLEHNITMEQAVVLYKAASSLKPWATAEVGFAYGVSAAAITQALRDQGRGVHHVMDPFQQNYHDAGLAMIRRAGLDAHFVFHRKFAEDVFPSLPPLQYVLIDASHLFDLTLTEFVLADKRLAVGGMIAFHDLWMPGLQKLIRFILENRAYEVVRDFDTPEEQPGRVGLKRRLMEKGRSLLNGLPRAERYFSPELLRPWGDYRLPDLVLLRKTAEDRRPWEHYRSF